MLGATYKYIIFLEVKKLTPQYMCTRHPYKKNLICRLTGNGEAPLCRQGMKKPSVETPGQNIKWLNQKKSYPSNSALNSAFNTFVFFAVLMLCSPTLIRTSCPMYLLAKFSLTNLFNVVPLYTTLNTSCNKF